MPANPCAASSSSRARNRARMAGWVIASSRLRRSGAAKTIAPSFFRSSVPLAFRTPGPTSATIVACAGCTGSTTSRARTSASMISAPNRRRTSDTVLFPVAMPPVSPTSRNFRASFTGLASPAAAARTTHRLDSHLRPVAARLHVDYDGDLERERGGHDLPGERLDRADLRGRRLAEELVVHLQEHPGAQSARRQRRLHADHRDLDHVAG